MLNKVLSFFEKLSSIPRSTFNEKEVADYICQFAKDRKLDYFKDKFNNVLVKKVVDPMLPTTVFQSHLDMVCIKEPNYDIDFLKDPIKLIRKGNYLSAYKTSLGADNGIGVAMILAIIDSCNYNIEALFTTDEEVTMTGATNFDYSLLSSKDIISLDGFSQNKMIVGCASICDMKVSFNPKFKKLQKIQTGFKLTVSGLKGGHSGADIAKPIGNAIKVILELLNTFKNIQLQNFESGNQFNFIPNTAEVTFTGFKDEEKYSKAFQFLKEKYPSLKITCEQADVLNVIDTYQTKQLLDFLSCIQTGVIKRKNKKIILSQNLACVSLQSGLIKISQRGHSEGAENQNIFDLQTLANKYNFEFSIFDKQTGFETDKNCCLAKNLIKVAKNQNLRLVPENKHISLEACVFKNKMPDANIVVVSPTILDPHSTKERVYLPSITKIFNLIIGYLEFCAGIV